MSWIFVGRVTARPGFRSGNLSLLSSSRAGPTQLNRNFIFAIKTRSSKLKLEFQLALLFFLCFATAPRELSREGLTKKYNADFLRVGIIPP